MWMMVTLVCVAMAEDPAPESAPEPPPPPPVELDPEQAAKLEDITTADLQYFEPKRHLLPQEPFAQTDFTAYTLEWGEVKVGLASVSVGLLPRFQASTVPVLDALRVYNGTVKFDALRAGPFDFALGSGFYVLPIGGFTASYMSPGLTVSMRPTASWSVHVGGSYLRVRGSGFPDLDKVPRPLYGLTQAQLDEWEEFSAELQQESAINIAGDGSTLRIATDYRFNRRDSIVLNFSSILSGKASGNASIPLLGVGESFQQDTSFLQSWNATLSYQVTWKQVDLRLGGGYSAYPLVWLVQGNDVSYRFGGETRRTETKTKRGFRQNVKDTK